MAQWYPKIAEFDFEGWHADPYIAREFHGVWGNFDVKITIDKKYLLGGTGYLQNGNEIGYNYQNEGVEVKYAIHPVAGRMPGHMNVLLAESNVSYDKLIEMDDINPEFKNTDVVLIVGANDVVNPAAKTDPSSPIYGMPILDVEDAAHTVVFKRSMKAGYAGIENELFYSPKNSMLFGDAKKSLTDLVTELKNLA
jgi:NAD(P) transhydrogenase subunit beta